MNRWISAWWFYGKLLRHKATLVSLDFLPNFYALSENFGDYEHDYLEEYRDRRDVVGGEADLRGAAEERRAGCGAACGAKRA